MKDLSRIVTNVKPSGIRKFFDLASTVEGCISLGVGEPDFDTPWHICDAVVDSLQRGKTHYTANRGLLELRQEISRFHASHYNQHYNPETEIIVTTGGSEAIDIAFRALLNPGDEVIVLDPNYVAYEPIITMAGGVVVPIELKEENEFKLLPQDLEKHLTSKTKAIMLNFPSNPTGGVMLKEDYDKLLPLLKESGIYIVSDEIYSELIFDEPFASLAQYPQLKDQVIVINGFSKAYAMTGWRLGYTLANETVSEAMNKIHQYIIMSAPTPAQYGALHALRYGYDDVIAMRQAYQERRNLVCSRLNAMGLKTNLPKGTFYVFANIQSTGLSSEEFAERLLQSQKIAVVPGTAFGLHGQGFIRLSYATSMDNLKKALDKINLFLQELSNKS